MIGRAGILAWHTLRMEARDRKGYVLRTALGGICVINLLFLIDDMRRTSAPGLELLTFQIGMTFFALSLLTLATFCNLIGEEREQGTLGLLKLAGFPALSILLGKSLRSLAVAAMLLCVQLPFSVLCIALGGVALEQVLRCYVLLVAQGLFLASIGLFWSVQRPTVRQASMGAWLTVILVYVSPTLAVGVAQGLFAAGGGAQQLVEWYAKVVGSPSMLGDVFVALRGRSGPWFPTSVWVAMGVALTLFLVSLWTFEARTRSLGGAAEGQSRTLRRAGTRASRRVEGNPLAWKEFHVALGGRIALAIRILLILLLFLLMGASGLSEEGREGWSGAMISTGLSLLAFEFLMKCGHTLGRERTENTLFLLGLLPISTPRAILSKLRGGMRMMVPAAVVVGIGVGLAPHSVAENVDWLLSEAMEGIWLALGSAVFVCALALQLSLVVRRGAPGLALLVCIAANVLGALMFRGSTPVVTGTGLLIVGFVLLTTVPETVERRIGEGS